MCLALKTGYEDSVDIYIYIYKNCEIQVLFFSTGHLLVTLFQFCWGGGGGGGGGGGAIKFITFCFILISGNQSMHPYCHTFHI